MNQNNQDTQEYRPEMSNPFIFTMESLRQSSRDLLTQVQAKISSGDQFTVDSESAVLYGYVMAQVKEIQAITGDDNDNGMNAFFTILSMYITVGQLHDEKFFGKLANASGSFISQFGINEDEILNGSAQGQALAQIINSFSEIVDNHNIEPDTESFSKILYFLAHFISGSLEQDESNSNDENTSIEGIFDDADYTKEELIRIQNIDDDAFQTIFEGVISGGIGFKDTISETAGQHSLGRDEVATTVMGMIKSVTSNFNSSNNSSHPKHLLSLVTIYITAGLIQDDEFVGKLTDLMLTENSMTDKDIFKISYRDECIENLINLLHLFDETTPVNLDIKSFSGILAAAVLELSNASDEEKQTIFGMKPAVGNSETPERRSSCYNGPVNPMRLRFVIDQSIADEDSTESLAKAEKIASDFYAAKASAGETSSVDDFSVSGSMSTILRHIQQLSAVDRKLDPRHYYFVM